MTSLTYRRRSSRCSTRRQIDPNLEFCNGDDRDSCIVLIQQNRVKVMAGSLQVNQDRRVQQQSAHRPSSSPGPVTSSGSRRSQTDLRSSIHAGSGRWARRTAFNAAPFARGGAPSWAMTRPRRTIVKVSSRCSTASRRSAKLREASVAETSDMEVRLSDYLVWRDQTAVLRRRGPGGLPPRPRPPVARSTRGS